MNNLANILYLFSCQIYIVIHVMCFGLIPSTNPTKNNKLLRGSMFIYNVYTAVILRHTHSYQDFTTNQDNPFGNQLLAAAQKCFLLLLLRYQDSVQVLSCLEDLTFRDDNIIGQSLFISGCLNIILYAGKSRVL